MIEQMYSIYYGDKMEEDQHFSQLFTDFLCYCRCTKSDECPAPIMIEAAKRAHFEIPDGSIPMEFAWLNHPAIMRFLRAEEFSRKDHEGRDVAMFPLEKIDSNTAFALESLVLLRPLRHENEELEEQSDLDAEAEYTEEEDEDTGRPLGVPYTDVLMARNDHFRAMADAYYGDHGDTSTESLTHLIHDVLLSLDDVSQFRHALSSAASKYTAIMGLEFNFLATELYSYDELVSRGDKASTDQMLREIGYDPTEQPSVPGAEIIAYIEKRSRDKKSES